MKKSLRLLVVFFLLGYSGVSYSQLDIKLNPEKVKQFLPYLKWKHGGEVGFPSWKENNKLLYAQEMWYYSESFYVKRNVTNDGYTLDESMIDITRFEHKRIQTEEVVIPMPGYKDALVLLPENKLIYKP